MLIKQATFRKAWHRGLRAVLARLPRETRFALYRRMIDCDPAPDARLELKVANTREELEACFRILHDAYVAAGFMKPAASGMRVTPYHALPTTTTLCAKYDGRVVGTISMIREGVFGFPMQAAFDLSPVRAEEGQIAEISALAVHPDFRKTGGAILFPLMKFMYEYCTQYFDTRHLVIAVNPDRIEMYESLLFFERLQENTVDHYDFANGAPAVGATLDLVRAREVFRKAYSSKAQRKNLYRYFVELRLPHIKLPRRRYHLTNDPVLTPEMLDYFFNRQTAVFEELDDRRRVLLWSIYDQPEFRPVLPMLREDYVSFAAMRRHQRFSMRCPAEVRLVSGDREHTVVMTIIELSLTGFQARSKLPLEIGAKGDALVELGVDERSRLRVEVVREHQADGASFYGFRVSDEDDAWRRCVAALETRHVGDDL
ncbi:GNAT family N-acetyltransferase [Roseateles asaccharophilus]|uniref:GNAT superfamily N-acetyltransferase n=1 Tax=Roseateles asaccharophilus TaxID=582607 RepID=A0ABU2AAQ1_9BURK|nr:GNAT family N-acetyltransferase [Roseateles asaccharophilus]MDR7334195.1 GNAT superfamily N-acetyltransferase [Roseateles asaccharophilus]